ncbi:Zinc finger protein 354C [Frankliniella fusca]|uniref:Zinc finger protein 354C n=1 Tax=Frankliniella fusca TaxID=407009 RepID=A0AAE1H639_9NEOP|nr:Zinc finger protein 354C [Frankliniella fusca]
MGYLGSHDYPCRFCGKVLSRKWSWLQHEATHTGALPHRCPVCERSFGNTYRLNRHMQSSHTDERPHRCDECGASFAVLASFQRHLRTHTGERAHVCAVCHKAFYEPYKLKRHMRVHGGKGHRKD